jgi:hypothetical protein
MGRWQAAAPVSHGASGDPPGVAAGRAGVSCPACGASGAGRYCSACGERFPTDQDFSIRHFFLESLPHELLDLDARFLRTLKTLLLRPGMLASEFVAGRRRAYLPPLRFYVIVFLFHATLVAFLSGSHARSVMELIRNTDPGHFLAHLAASRGGIDWSDPEVRNSLHERGRWLGEIGTMLVFLAVALVQKVIFFRSGRKYLEHVTLALNVVTFYIVVMIVIDLGLGILVRPHFADFDVDASQLIGITLLPLYWFLALRRFYRLRAPPALLGTALLWASNVAIAWCLNVLVLAILIETA